MTGYGTSYGAISVMNAIPCGIGSTIGISLRTEAVFEPSDSTTVELIDRPDTDDTLVRTCVQRTLDWIGQKTEYRLTVRTDIPPSMGLKSSSSVCNAVISAVLDHYRVRKDRLEVIKLGVECAKECKVTITGAFDDACGCHLGGLVVTDNRDNRILLKKPVPRYDVVIIVPDKTIPKNKVPVDRYKEFSSEYEKMVPTIGDSYLKVLTKNGEAVGSIVDDGGIAKKAMALGALAAGVTGTGPAVAIIAEEGQGHRIAEKLGRVSIMTTTRSEIAFQFDDVKGKVDVPPSKSYTHRAILMSALSRGRCVISNPLDSFDTRATMDAVRAMGAEVIADGGKITIDSTNLHAPDRTIDVLNSGTTMRLMTGIASLFDVPITITGDESIRKRPMKSLLDALEGCGVRCISDEGKAPLTIKGPISGSEIRIDGSISSQFVSSMLMMAPLVGRPVDIIVEGNQVSKPYVEITVSMMKSFGIEVQRTGSGFHVEPQQYRPCDYTVPSDFSSAAFPLVAGGLGGSVTVEGLDMEDPQGDKRIVDILRDCGCDVKIENGTITCSRKGRPKALDIDLSDIPDLFPIIAVLLSTADGTSHLYGAPQLRFKESDRIASVERMLRSLGADITGTDDGCIINGVEKLKGGRIEHLGDHRLFMSAAIASLISEGFVSMDNDGCWNVSYPGFVDKMLQIVQR